jgi:hypothetical protein
MCQKYSFLRRNTIQDVPVRYTTRKCTAFRDTGTGLVSFLEQIDLSTNYFGQQYYISIIFNSGLLLRAF